MLIEAAALTAGCALGRLALLQEPLSLWGGIDLQTGAIIDQTHPQCGLVIANRILAMKSARGSSSSSSALVETARLGVAPAAIILGQHDAILVMGALVAADLYGVQIPIIVLAPPDWHRLVNGQELRITAAAKRASIIDS